jgi:hypothetical protein
MVDDRRHNCHCPGFAEMNLMGHPFNIFHRFLAGNRLKIEWAKGDGFGAILTAVNEMNRRLRLS